MAASSKLKESVARIRAEREQAAKAAVRAAMQAKEQAKEAAAQAKEQAAESKVYSGVESLPGGQAPATIVEGCVVLEGGAFRGVYGEGVLDALMQSGVNLQATVGVSAGALNGYNYVAGLIGRSARINLTYRHDGRYVGPRALKENHGLIGFDFVFEEQDDKAGGPVDEARFNDPRRRFVAVVANLVTGRAEYHDRDEVDDIKRSIQASASMPYLSEPVEINGMPYLDGGCCDKIPVRWAIEEGYEKIVVVRTQDASYRKKRFSDSARLLAQRAFKEYPAFVDAYTQSPERYNAKCDDIERLQKQGRIFVIGPTEPVQISHFEGDMDKLGALYWRGYRDAVDALPALLEYLGIEE